MTPRTKEQYEKMRKESKEDILRSSLYLFANKGFYNTTINDIAKRAKVSKGLIYNYFESKEDILNNLMKSLMDINKSFESLLSKGEITEHREFFKNIINTMASMLEEKPDFWKLYNSLFSQPDILEKYSDDLHIIYDKSFKAIEEIFNNAGSHNPNMDTRIFLSVLKGMQIYHIFLGEKIPFEETGEYLIDLLFNKGGEK